MVMGLVRCPLSFYDITPSSHLTNKFSNDLGILDNSIASCYTNIIDRLILWIVMLGSIVQMDIIYMIPAFACIIFFVFFFNFCKQSIVSTKQLNLQLRTPIFQELKEMTSGLIIIGTFNQKERVVKEFEESLDTSLKGDISHITIERAFGVLIYYVTIVILVIGMELGAMRIKD